MFRLATKEEHWSNFKMLLVSIVLCGLILSFLVDPLPVEDDIVLEIIWMVKFAVPAFVITLIFYFIGSGLRDIWKKPSQSVESND